MVNINIEHLVINMGSKEETKELSITDRLVLMGMATSGKLPNVNSEKNLKDREELRKINKEAARLERIDNFFDSLDGLELMTEFGKIKITL